MLLGALETSQAKMNAFLNESTYLLYANKTEEALSLLDSMIMLIQESTESWNASNVQVHDALACVTDPIYPTVVWMNECNEAVSNGTSNLLIKYCDIFLTPVGTVSNETVTVYSIMVNRGGVASSLMDFWINMSHLLLQARKYTVQSAIDTAVSALQSFGSTWSYSVSLATKNIDNFESQICEP